MVAMNRPPCMLNATEGGAWVLCAEKELGLASLVVRCGSAICSQS